MRMKNLLMVLSASCLLLSITACSDDEKGGKKGNINPVTALNIQNARLIYGVEQPSALRSTRSDGDDESSNNGYYKITTEEEKEEIKFITNIGEIINNDYYYPIHIYGMADINEDYIIINSNLLNDPNYNGEEDWMQPDHAYGYGLGYVANKKTGEILNPHNPIQPLDISNIGSLYSSYYDGSRYCYITHIEGIHKIDLVSFSVELIFEGAIYTRISSDGTYFVRMRPDVSIYNTYGNFKTGVYMEFPSDSFVVDGCNDNELIVIERLFHRMEDGGELEPCLSFSTLSGGVLTGDNFRFNINIHNPDGIFVGHSSFASGNLIIHISDMNNRNNPILLNYNVDKNEVSHLHYELADGFSSGSHGSHVLSLFPKIITNGTCSYNLKWDELVITDHRDFTQKTIKDVNGYQIKGITSGNEKMTFIGEISYLKNNNPYVEKQCIGEIYANGESKILKEFDADDNESMDGFIMQLR